MRLTRPRNYHDKTKNEHPNKQIKRNKNLKAREGHFEAMQHGYVRGKRGDYDEEW